MKTTISLMAMVSLLVSGASYATGGAQTYGGTGAGLGGFVNKTGLVKERGDEENHMDGKESGSDEKISEPADGDVPPDEDSSSDKTTPKN